MVHTATINPSNDTLDRWVWANRDLYTAMAKSKGIGPVSRLMAYRAQYEGIVASYSAFGNALVKASNS